jgi:beta-lactam-binding protein with PASTA domain
LLPPSNTVTVPSFIGQSIGDAEAEIQRVKLSSAVIDRTTSDRYPKDVVIMQRPEAGAQVREGRQISFVVSEGIVALLMPDLRYQSMREVALDLSRVRMRLGKVSYVKNDIVPDGHVVSQDPPPLSNIAQGDTVSLVLSRGGLSVVAVPNFAGMQIDAARALAEQSGIKLGQVVWTPLGPTGPPHGEVVRQTPAAGGKIGSFEPVSLQVSSGPFESGHVIRQVRLLVSVPVADVSENQPQQQDVRVTVTDATGKFDLYHAFAQAGQKLDFTVTAIGTSLVDLYVNDRLVGETRLGAEPPVTYGNKPVIVTPLPSSSPLPKVSKSP